MKTFYLEPEAWREPFVLDGPEAHHMLAVLRTRAGDEVRLFDGQGRAGRFRVERAEKKRAHLVLLEETTAPRPAPRICLAIGWSKALRRSWLLEKAVELEAAGLWFWQGKHSQGAPPDVIKEGWQGSLVAGAKQSGNAWLPELRVVPGGVKGLAEAARGFDRAFVLWEGQDQHRMLDYPAVTGAGSILFAVGPEGGFDPAEVDTLVAGGFAPVSLGRRILRWETAALLCLGVAWWAGQTGTAMPSPTETP
ncbi:MAG: 16S rRNA (uracil(1498)-N(3))-methyltransferase [Desulfovibrionaceae bacterium]